MEERTKHATMMEHHHDIPIEGEGDLRDHPNAPFKKTNDREDFLSVAKIQFKVQQDGYTVSKMLIIGCALTSLCFEAKPRKQIQVEPSWDERISKNGARKSDRLWV